MNDFGAGSSLLDFPFVVTSSVQSIRLRALPLSISLKCAYFKYLIVVFPIVPLNLNGALSK